MSSASRKRRVLRRVLFENSLFLIGGAICALIWANTSHDSYENFKKLELWGSHHDSQLHIEPGASSPTDGTDVVDPAVVERPADASGADGDKEEPRAHAHNTLEFLVNDVLMALFFAIAAKEVWEALLPGGALSSFKKAATPLLATLGGMVGPAALFLGGAAIIGEFGALGRGWAIPCATDIAFSFLIARIIFGPGHPAIAFLLLLAIADDAAGLVILAVAYPAAPPQPAWLLLAVAAFLIGVVFHKRFRLQSFWWYLLVPGVLSWFAFFKAGLHPALGLVPVIPSMPHAHTDLGIFVRTELQRHDTLNAFEHWWKNPVELILGLFGLVNAGVLMNSVGSATGLVLLGLLIGKPLGVTLFTMLGQKFFKLEVPRGMGMREVVTVGMIAGIGFTVSLIFSTAAFKPGDVLDAAKMGALGSFGAAILAIVLAKLIGVKKWNLDAPEGETSSAETEAVPSS